MLELIEDMPAHVVAVRATGEVTKSQYEQVLEPALEKLSKQFKKVNLLLDLETEVSHFTAGAWMQDALIGLKYITRWHRVAIVTKQEAVKKFTDIFSIAVPGEYKGFSMAELEEAKRWVCADN